MINARYKDTVFRDLFGSKERKHYTLSLYNALAGTSYDDPNAIEVTTLADVLYMNVKNDISFIIDEEMTLWEHQSTFNPNMPLRGLIYFSRLYAKYVRSHELSIYGSKRLKLPTPRYVVFYNGTAKRPEREVLRLSDSFELEGADVEVCATMVNINLGKNPDVLAACEALMGYSTLVSKIRSGLLAGLNNIEAIRAAVNECIENGILKEYLISKKSEVIEMFMTEYNEDEVREMFKRDGREEGRTEGREEGLAEGREEGKREVRESTLAAVATLVRQDELSVASAIAAFGFTEAEIRAAMENIRD